MFAAYSVVPAVRRPRGAILRAIPGLALGPGVSDPGCTLFGGSHCPMGGGWQPEQAVPRPTASGSRHPGQWPQEGSVPSPEPWLNWPVSWSWHRGEVGVGGSGQRTTCTEPRGLSQTRQAGPSGVPETGEKGAGMALSIPEWSSPDSRTSEWEGPWLTGSPFFLPWLLPSRMPSLRRSPCQAQASARSGSIFLGQLQREGWSPFCHLPSCFRLCPPQTHPQSPQLCATWPGARLTSKG